MSKLRVHELAKEIGRQNKEVMNYLKTRGLDIKSHMSMVEEPWISEVKNKFNNRGKEHIAKLDTPKTEEKVVTAKSEGDKTEAPKKKKNIIRVYHAQNASDGGKTTRKKPVRAEGERTGSPRNAEGRASDNSRTDGDRPRRNNGDRSGAGNRRPQGDGNRQGRPQGEGRAQGDGNRQGGRFGGQGRSQGDGQGRQGGRPQGDGNRQGGRFGGQGRSQGDGQGRQGGRFQGDGNRQGGRFGQGRSQGDNRQGGRPQGNGQGRPDGNRGEGRFGGGQGRQGQRQNTRKNDDMVFAPELTKTSKDSKRERDRENKNKKKDFDKSQGGGRRPNQGGFNKNSRIPKALQKPTPQPKQEEKKPEVKEITLPEKMTIRELAEAMKMQPSVIVKKLFMEGMMVTVNHEIDFEKAQEIALDYDIIAELEEKVDVIEELLK